MNIEGNPVIFTRNGFSVVDKGYGADRYTVCQQKTQEYSDGTAFRYWTDICRFDNEDAAIAFVFARTGKVSDVVNHMESEDDLEME